MGFIYEDCKTLRVIVGVLDLDFKVFQMIQTTLIKLI